MIGTKQARILGTVLVTVVLLCAAAAHAKAGTQAAEDVVRDTVDQVLEVLTHTDWSVEERVSAIEKIAYTRFDFETISRLVLARNYNKFSDAQKREFVEEFKSHLSRSYGNRIDRYEQEAVKFISARMEPRGDVTVLTRITGGQADGIEMNYRVRDREAEGGWMLIDVVIEGVSLVSSFRSQFKEIVNQGGPALLLEKLKDKNSNFDVPTGS